MGYTPTDWKKRIVDTPDKYTLVDLGGGLFTITPSEGAVTQEGTPLTEANLNHLETQYDEAGTDLTAHKTNATPPGVHRWTAGKLLKGAGAGANPVEIDVPKVPPDSETGSSLLISADTEKSTMEVTYSLAKRIKLSRRDGTFRISFGLKIANAAYIAYGKVYKNGVAVGTEQTTSSDTYVTKSEDIAGFSGGDNVELYYHTNDANYGASVNNFRIYSSIPEVSTVIIN